MTIFNLTLPLSLSFITYKENQFLLILAILVLAITIILRSKILFFLQLLLLPASLLQVDLTLYGLNILLNVIQIIFFLFIVFAWMKAVKRNYLMIMEKTHKMPRTYTKNAETGSVSDFVFNKDL